MREIIFRGKRIDNGEWVYGWPFADTADCSLKKVGKCGCPHDGSKYFIVEWVDDFHEYEEREVIPDTVGQYTGLKDKNGKRIFEGDILGSRYDNLYLDDVAIEVVKWFRNGWYIQQENNLPNALCEYGVLPYSEVIGNVHENPELLKEEAQT